MTESDGTPTEKSTDRDVATGKFLPGNKARGPGGRNQSSRAFKTWLRAFFEKPETKKLIEEKIDRDLRGDGPAAFAIRMLSYAEGEPRQVIEFEIRREAEKLAEDSGIDAQELLAAAERLAGGAIPN